MKMGSKENYSPTNFKTKDANLIGNSPMMMHKEGHDPKKKKPTTSIKNALASEENYQLVPGYEERLGGELEGVTVTANFKKQPKNKKPKKKFKYTKVGKFLGNLGPSNTFKYVTKNKGKRTVVR